MKKILLFVFICFSFSGFAQEKLSSDTITAVAVNMYKKTTPALLKKELELKALFDKMIEQETNDSARIAINNEINEKLMLALKDSNSFFYPFDSLRYLGKIYSDDYNIRVYTWCIELEDTSYKFYGLIHDFINERVYPLVVRNKPYIPHPNHKIALTNWYGALYYKAIVINPKKRDPDYILLGWNQSDSIRKNKIIEVLNIEDDGEDVRLGSKMFKGYSHRVNRMVLSYCADMGITLSYDEKNKQFIFDHLTPISDNFDKPRGCYGPDMSYDALKWKRWSKRWVIKKDVDVKNNF